MATLGPDYAEAEAHFRRIRDAVGNDAQFERMQAAAKQWSDQQDALRPKAEEPSQAEQELQLLRAANMQSQAVGLGPIDTSKIEARIASEKQVQALERDRSDAIAQTIPGVNPASAAAAQFPPAPPLPLKNDGIIDASDLTPDQISRIGYASVDPATVAMGQEAFDASIRGIRREQQAIKQSVDGMGQAQKEADAAAYEQYLTTAEKNKSLQVASSEANRLSGEHAKAVKQLVADSSAEVAAQMVRVRQSADEAANAQIKDFWADKSTGGRILGIISQALAGAANGLSGQPGASTPLDKIIAMDLERQKINLNQKTTTSYREQGILGLMRQNFSSQLEAGAAAYGAAINHVDMLAKDIAQRYGTPEAKAAYDKFHADNALRMEQGYAQAHNALLTSHIQTAQLSSTMISRLNSANVAANSGANKGPGAQGDLHILGLKGPVNKQTFAAMNKHSSALGGLLGNYQRVSEMLQGGVKITPEWIKEFNANKAQIVAALRVQDDTGKRLEGQEAANLETRVPQLTEAMIGSLTPKQLLDYSRVMDNMVNTVVRSYTGRIHAISRNPYDYDDPQIGQYMKRIATPASSGEPAKT